MKKLIAFILAACFAGAAQGAENQIWLEGEDAGFDPSAGEIVKHPPFVGGRGIAAKECNRPTTEKSVEAVFEMELPQSGCYILGGIAASRNAARKLMEKRSAARNKLGLFITISIDCGPAKRRVAIEPWRNQDKQYKEYGKYQLEAGKHQIAVQLPPGVMLDRLELHPYKSPAIPEGAKKYQPLIIPNMERPRLWVTGKTLESVRRNLQHMSHRDIYMGIKKQAASTPPASDSPDFNRQYQRIALAKAFVGLMENSPEAKRDAVAMLLPYLHELDFGNELDSFRKAGETIYHASLVYDWCRDQISDADAANIRSKLLELAREMEIGWPPFRQIVTNGHGNEDQLNRNLLAMAIALYGEDDQPYGYCIYRILEELVPLRNLEYQSGRHNQGINYGIARLGYEMLAAHLLRRMSGQEVFDPAIKRMGYFWLYSRLPDGTMLLNGDMNLSSRYWRYPDQFFLLAAYAEDPLLMGEFERQGGKISDPILYLLLNDPSMKSKADVSDLPLTRYFTGVLPAMIARTGWKMGEDSTDAVVEFKGGGEYAGNHQHADAGAFQIYYRGTLATDLGMYGFYGLPYDFNFNKRSIAHNVMLVYDPSEKFQRDAANDGGQRFSQSCPANLQDLQSEAWYHTGKNLNCAFGPDIRRPSFSYLKCDIGKAYSDKVEQYTRTFCFLRHDQPGYPGTLIVFDRIRSSRPDLKKYWLLNTLSQPELSEGRHRVRSGNNGGPGMLTTTMLIPDDPEICVAGGGNAHAFFGIRVSPPRPALPQAQGYRTMFSPRTAQQSDRFLAVMQIHDAGIEVPKVAGRIEDDIVKIMLGDSLVVIGIPEPPTKKSFSLQTPAGMKKTRVLIADVAPGIWTVRGNGTEQKISVGKEEGCAFLTLDNGIYEFRFEQPPSN